MEQKKWRKGKFVHALILTLRCKSLVIAAVVVGFLRRMGGKVSVGVREF
jgi:hypothetical protein